MRCARDRAARGYTLIELLVAHGALLVLFGVLGQILVAQLRVISLTTARYNAAVEASHSMAIAIRDLSDAAMLTDAGKDYLQYLRPQVGSDGLYMLAAPGTVPGELTGVRVADQVRIYYDPDARILYRQVIPEYGSGETADEPEAVAHNVEHVEFLYDGVAPTFTEEELSLIHI